MFLKFQIFILIFLIFLCSALITVSAHHLKDCVNTADLGNYFINSCEEKCVCEQNAAGDFAHVCYREREELTCMSFTRRLRFLNAFKAISTPGNPQYEQYEQLIAAHNGINAAAIHSTAFFLPWHRWYIMALEDLLRNEDCRVTVPWWRWSKKSFNWWTGTPFHPATSWLGTNSQNQCVQDGTFKLPWKPPQDVCLRYNFYLNFFPTALQISNVLNLPFTSFSTFSNTLAGPVHIFPHVLIGGQLSFISIAPRSPVFFFHHGYIDKLWDQWQKQSNDFLTSYDFPMNQQLPGVFGVTPSNVQDHFDLKASGVIYVNRKSLPSGPGHIFFPPFCLWLVNWPNIYDLSAVEAGIQTLARDGQIYDVPQLSYPITTAEDLKRQFRPWFEPQDRATSAIIDENIEEMFTIMSRENEKLKSPQRNFSDDVSNMVGYDIETIASATNICPLGQKFKPKTRRCKKARKERKMLRVQLKKVEIVGAEAVDMSTTDEVDEM